MQIIDSIAELREYSRSCRQAGQSIGFVPTMGSLHQGHLSLVAAAREQCDAVIISVFVNPTQFGVNEDYGEYPRDLEHDSELATAAGVDVLFAPQVQEMYPEGFSTFVEMSGLTQKLCGLSRPTFFRGVCTVVLKLLNIVGPDKAFFGQKDAQQYLVVKKMAAELNLAVEIVSLPIVREADGLALSSRNQYLSPVERQEALVLSASLREAEDLIFNQGICDVTDIKQRLSVLISNKATAKIDYIEILALPDLRETAKLTGGQYLLALAVWIGATRLIDNTIITIKPGWDPAQINLLKAIRRLKEERQAVILAHLYQQPEIQQVADYVGDSLGLAQQAAQTDAKVIVFCGVHFMAESASILSPDKVVLLPEPEAGCPMADMITAEQLRQLKAEHPEAVVVTYVNSSAEVKAESDIICTSANAVKVVNSIPADKQIIFVPDRNLGAYAASRTGRELLLWPGYCPAHDQLRPEDISRLQAEHPGAPVLVHPEARPEVLALADYVCSTSQMLDYVRQSQQREFIIGTEEGILYQLTSEFPDKRFYLAAPGLYCASMKQTSLAKLKKCLEELQPQVQVAPEIRDKAQTALQRMLEIK